MTSEIYPRIVRVTQNMKIKVIFDINNRKGENTQSSQLTHKQAFGKIQQPLMTLKQKLIRLRREGNFLSLIRESLKKLS